MKTIINLIDTNIAHAPSFVETCCNDRKPQNVQYVRGLQAFDGITIFTDACLKWSPHVSSKIKAAWLMEPRAVDARAHEEILSYENYFDVILTFDEDLLRRSRKYVFMPCQSVWCDSKTHRADNDKTNMCSMIFSDKQWLLGHKLRHAAAEIIREKNLQVDLFGKGAGKPIVNKSVGLASYRFSIVIENAQQNHYFTEKILDCFSVGTVPLYWGSKNIGDYFDTASILQFNTLEELQNHIANLHAGLYDEMRDAISTNFHLSMKYLQPDDMACSKILEVAHDKL